MASASPLFRLKVLLPHIRKLWVGAPNKHFEFMRARPSHSECPNREHSEYNHLETKLIPGIADVFNQFGNYILDGKEDYTVQFTTQCSLQRRLSRVRVSIGITYSLDSRLGESVTIIHGEKEEADEHGLHTTENRGTWRRLPQDGAFHEVVSARDYDTAENGQNKFLSAVLSDVRNPFYIGSIRVLPNKRPQSRKRDLTILGVASYKFEARMCYPAEHGEDFRCHNNIGRISPERRVVDRQLSNSDSDIFSPLLELPPPVSPNSSVSSDSGTRPFKRARINPERDGDHIVMK